MKLAPLSWIPKPVMMIVREAGRHVLRHPVSGVMAAARTEQGRWLLVRRADTGTWSMPGGTLEWGETLRASLEREVREETGATVLRIERLVGVYSRPDRDTRFHAVTVVAEVVVDASRLGAMNPLEIREVGLFDADRIPYPLAFEIDDMMRDAIEGRSGVLE